MTTLKLDAYIPSKGEYEKYFNKFRAFMSADVSEKAKEQGAYCDENYNGKGCLYPLRSALAITKVYYGYSAGRLTWDCSYDMRAGLRVAFKVIYNPDSSLVKGCRTEKRTTLVHDVYDEKEKKNIDVTSSAPIVKFWGGKIVYGLTKKTVKVENLMKWNFGL